MSSNTLFRKMSVKLFGERVYSSVQNASTEYSMSLNRTLCERATRVLCRHH